MSVRLLSPAEEEIAESAEFYFGESPQAAAAFLEEIDRAVELIGLSPYRYRIHAKDVRVKHLDRFPFSLFYRIDGRLRAELEILLWALVNLIESPSRGRTPGT